MDVVLHATARRLNREARRRDRPARRRAYNRVWHAAHPGADREYKMRRYGISTADYEARLVAQGGVCAICGQPERMTNPRTGLVQRLQIDHDHACCSGRRACGKCVRGLLCVACNHVIGRVQEDPTRLRAAADYLEEHAR